MARTKNALSSWVRTVNFGSIFDPIPAFLTRISPSGIGSPGSVTLSFLIIVSILISAPAVAVGTAEATHDSGGVHVEDPGTDNVDNDGNTSAAEDTDGDSVYSTIQYAVNNTSSGSTVEVSPGTYEERLNLSDTEGLSIIGSGQQSTVIEPTGTVNWGSRTAFASRTAGVKAVNAANLSVSRVTISFQKINTTAVTGLLFWDSNGTIRNSTLREMSNPSDPVDLTSYYGTSAPANTQYTSSDRAHILIADSRFVETGRIGVNADDFTNVTVRRSHFETTDAGYGVEIGSEATGRVVDSTFTGFDVKFGDGSTSAGIYIENAFPDASGVSKPVGVVNSTVTESSYGVAIGNSFPTLGGDVQIQVRLRDNTLRKNTVAGVNITDTDAAAGSSVVVEAAGNNISNNGRYGYQIEPVDDGNITLSARNESLSGQPVAVLVNNSSVDSEYEIAVNGSTIAGNGDGIRNNDSTLTVNAGRNWWGDATGPSGAGPGVGDSVSQNVTFDPFYVNAERSVLSTVDNSSTADGGETAVVELPGSTVNNTSVSLPEGDDNVKVSVVSADKPTGSASTPSQQTATYLDIATNQSISDDITITVNISRSTLESAGIDPSDAVILHYDNGAWRELDTDVSASENTVRLTSTVDDLSPFAVAPAAPPDDAGDDDGGGDVGDGASEEIATGERRITQEFWIGAMEKVGLEYEEPVDGIFTLERQEDLPVGAPSPDGNVVAVANVEPPSDLGDRQATLEFTLARSEIGQSVEDTQLVIVRVDADDEKLTRLDTKVVESTDESVTVATTLDSFSTFAVIVADVESPTPTETDTDTTTAAKTTTAASETHTTIATRSDPTESPPSTSQPPTTTPPSTSQSPTTTPSSTSTSGAGFGVIVAITASLCAILLVRRLSN
jgi:PGF-pre-PGF domain-containing protein